MSLHRDVAAAVAAGLLCCFDCYEHNGCLVVGDGDTRSLRYLQSLRRMQSEVVLLIPCAS